MDKPTVLVFAGPNGSGKSTVTKAYTVSGIYINADDIKRFRGCTDLEAAQEAELLRETLLDSRKDFTFETVLSTPRNLILLDKAKKAGYYIKSVFVLTADAELNVMRVKTRVQTGGHDVPEDKIRNRYVKSLKMVSKLALLCDELAVFDNTDRPEVIYKKDDEGEVFLPNDFWDEAEIKELIKADSQIAIYEAFA